jgi:hypothetical protein
MCRSFGMVHYFGAPNVRASAPHDDRQSIECSMQAVLQTCQRIARDNESPFNLKNVAVSAFRVADSSFPPIDWSATYVEDEVLIDLTTAALGARSKPGVFGRLKRLLRP